MFRLGTIHVVVRSERFRPGTIHSFVHVCVWCAVEMFEHMKNYQELLHRISAWLRPGGKLFVHIFVHRGGLPYHYEVQVGLLIVAFDEGPVSSAAE